MFMFMFSPLRKDPSVTVVVVVLPVVVAVVAALVVVVVAAQPYCLCEYAGHRTLTEALILGQSESPVFFLRSLNTEFLGVDFLN